VDEFTTNRIVINPIMSKEDELSISDVNNKLEELELHFL